MAPPTTQKEGVSGHDKQAVHQHEREQPHTTPDQRDDEDHRGDHEHDGHGGGHSGHGAHGMEMQMPLPGGLPMAQRGPDRDGLSLDCIHLALGPLLADWPGGLTIRLVLQGDVIQRAELDALTPFDGAPAHSRSFWHAPWLRAAAGEYVAVAEAARRRAAAHLDSLGRLLAVAGWPAAATQARRLRDDLLAGAAEAVIRPQIERFARRVGRSRTLYWLTRDIGVLCAAHAQAAGVTGPAAYAAGDVPARYRQWLAEVAREMGRLDERTPLSLADAFDAPRGRLDVERTPSTALIAVLPGMLTGTELAAARLIVASLDPDPDELITVRAAADRHG